MRIRSVRPWLTTLAVLGALLNARSAHAANVACSSLPNPLVVESGDTQQNLLKTVGRQLRNSAAPVTVLFNLTGSCQLQADMYSGTKLTQNLMYVPSTTEDPAWTTASAPLTCTNDIAGGAAIDVAISATFVSSCTTAPPPAPLGLIEGPVQGYGFVIPKANTSQSAIVAEEGYFVFGFGAAGKIDPWTDETQLFLRPPTKSTVLTLAAAVGVPAVKWTHGVPLDTSTLVLNSVAQSTKPASALGILGVEVADAHRDVVSMLAFRAYGQKHAFWPDSSPTSFDKANVRDGHYTPWAPTVYITAVDASNVPTNARVKTLVDLVLGNPGTPADVDGLGSVIKVGLIPQCAMKVKRDFEGGDLSPAAPASPCGCYFDSKVPQGASSCTTCTTDATCGAGKCRYGFCEAK
jgi:hypothetical protein